VIANSGRVRSAHDSCPGDSLSPLILRAMSHSAVRESDFCRLNELSKYRDKIGFGDGVVGLCQRVRMCVSEREVHMLLVQLPGYLLEDHI
jgi:hypothetical protein